MVGLAVVAAGVVMLVLPGPGWLVILAGLALWATEFVWAQRVTDWTKRQLRCWANRARRRVRERRRARSGRKAASEEARDEGPVPASRSGV